MDPAASRPDDADAGLIAWPVGIAREFEALAAAIGAREAVPFHLPRGEMRLHPARGFEQAGACATFGPGAALLAQHACRSPLPCFWMGEQDLSTAQQPLMWMEPLSLDAECEAGMAFPVQAEGGRTGVVVFLGSDIRLDERTLCDLHAACFRLYRQIVADDAQAMPARRTRSAMSRRELDCLKLSADGLTSTEIAARLGLSINTANQYLTSAARKLDAVNRTHAVGKALRLGLID